MSNDVIETSVGAARVLHRLSLGLVTRDVVTDRATTGPLRAGWEAAGHLLRPAPEDWWPCVDLERMGGGRFRLRASTRCPEQLTVRVVDPSRRYVARRLGVTLWPHAALLDASPANAVTVAARTTTVWLFPGATYPVSPGMTVVRGRVTRQGVPQPWARLNAVDPGGAILGRAHGDDRGEFVLLIAETNQNPLLSSVSVRLEVRGPADSPSVPAVEPLQRPSNPPLPGELDNAALRGRTPPPGYLQNTVVVAPFTVDVGEEMVLSTDVPFDR